MLKLLIESISMGRGLYGSSTSLLGSSSDHYGHCCPPVFDASTIAALIGGIALGMPSKKKFHMEGNLPYRGGGGSTKSLVKFKKK